MKNPANGGRYIGKYEKLFSKSMKRESAIHCLLDAYSLLLKSYKMLIERGSLALLLLTKVLPDPRVAACFTFTPRVVTRGVKKIGLKHSGPFPAA